MGDITFTRQSIGAIISGCGAGGVTCMGNGEMFAHMEDFGLLADPVTNRKWRSVDDGATWVELAPEETGNIWFYRSLSPATARVLVGTSGPNFSNGSGGYDPDVDDVVGVSQDRGDTFAAGVDVGTLFNPTVFNDIWATHDFIQLSATEVWALGEYTVNGVQQPSILTSGDGGLTFTAFGTDPASHRIVLSGAYLGEDNVVLGLEWASNTARIARSNDRGASWSIIALPVAGVFSAGTTSRVHTVCHLGNGVVLAGGLSRSTDGRRARLWRSTDFGVNWTELSTQVDTREAVLRIVKLSSTAAALVMQAALGGDRRTPYFTEDSGATWTAATMTDALIADYDFVDAAVADDGTVVALYTTPGAGGEDIYIYRGALVDIAGAGLCAEFEPPLAAGLLGVRLECVPIFSPVSCLVECPADPTPAVGEAVQPPATGGGFRAVLFFLGLTDGVPASPGVVLGLRSGCGATFANNLCAVAGC